MAKRGTKLGLLVLACLLATIVLWMLGKTVKEPPPMTPRRLAWGLATRLFEGHGCPNGALDPDLIECRFPRRFSNVMTYVSKPNGVSISTTMLRGKPHDLSDFRNVVEVGGYSVILWDPAHIFFVIHEKKLCLIAYDAHDIRDWGKQRGLDFTAVTNLVQLDAE